MGTGKSTLGRALAQRVPGLSFIDLDDATEAIIGCSAAEAFAAGCADDFRSAECEAVKAVCAMTNVVVACGGGTPCFGNNMDLMLAAGTVVRLNASRQRLLRRLEEADGQRPLVAGLKGEALLQRVEELQAAREMHYSRASAVFDATYLENEKEIDDSCRRFVAQFMSEYGNANPT